MTKAQKIKKTILSVLAAAVGIAVAFGWLTPEQVSELNPQLTSIGESAIGIFGAIGIIWRIFKPSSSEPTIEEEE